MTEYTRLNSIDVSAIDSLKELHVDQNYNVSSLDVSQNLKLIKLGCSFNQITSLDLRNNTQLTEVDARNNQLTRFDIRNGQYMNFSSKVLLNNNK